MYLSFFYGILGQVWYLSVSIPDLCLLPYFYSPIRSYKNKNAKGLYTDMVFLDLQKAFVTVGHNILFNNLKLVRSTKWFESYLGKRSQLVNIGKTYSDSAAVTCGIPQGVILGHLSFLCYV